MSKEKSRRNFLEESGVNVDLFELENEYSYRNILYAMEAYATYRIKILNEEIRESGKEFCSICDKENHNNFDVCDDCWRIYDSKNSLE